jgi:hypothetical protein
VLRQRHVSEYSDIPLEDDYEKPKESKSKIVRVIQRADMFQKTPHFVSKRTYLGAFLSFITIIFVCFLVISEFIMFLKTKRVDTLSVDLQKDGKILIYFNISFPHVKCAQLSVDSVDVSGEQHINIYYRMHKNPITAEGVIIPVDDFTRLGHAVTDLSKIPGSPFYCGPCYIENSARKCCNSCGDVLTEYEKQRRTPPDRTHIEQCVQEMIHNLPGCNMYGAMEVNKVAGNFHFAPGRSFSQEHETHVHHIHEFNPALIAAFNASHIIHELSFGERIPHVKYALDGLEQMTTKGSALYKYFIKVVPTSYKRGTLSFTVESYQFSFTKHHMEFDPMRVMMLPGVFFIYDLSPIKISYHDTSESFLHFIVSMCAVVGGVFVVSGYIDRLLHGIAGVVSKKTD